MLKSPLTSVLNPYFLTVLLSVAFNNLPCPFLRFNTDKDRFVCSVCNFHGRKRSTVLAHVKVAHRRELNAAVSNNTKLEEIPDCGKGMCKKLYGENEGRKFWCIKCAEDWKLYQLGWDFVKNEILSILSDFL